MIQFSVCCFTAVRSKGKRFGVAEHVVLGHSGNGSQGWQRQNLDLAHTWSSCSGVAARSVQSLQRGGSRAPRWQLGDLHHPAHNCRCPRMGLLLLPPSAPQQLPRFGFSLLSFTCTSSSIKPSVPIWLWGLWAMACSFRVHCHSPVLQFCTGYFNVFF